MKKVFLILVLFVLVVKVNAQEEEKSNWFGGSTTSYLALMELVPNDGDPATILMAGGEKPMYSLSEKSSINFWHFEYIDKAAGYVYGGPSFTYSFEKGFVNVGIAAGVTTNDFQFIYSFSFVGQYKKFGIFFNSEHNAWSNWHRAWVSYDLSKTIGIMAGSHGFYGPGAGLKLSYKKMQLQAMYHLGVDKAYLGSPNNTDGISLMFSVGL